MEALSSATAHHILRQAGMFGQTARPTETKGRPWLSELKMMKLLRLGHDIF